MAELEYSVGMEERLPATGEHGDQGGSQGKEADAEAHR